MYILFINVLTTTLDFQAISEYLGGSSSVGTKSLDLFASGTTSLILAVMVKSFFGCLMRQEDHFDASARGSWSNFEIVTFWPKQPLPTNLNWYWPLVPSSSGLGRSKHTNLKAKQFSPRYMIEKATIWNLIFRGRPALVMKTPLNSSDLSKSPLPAFLDPATSQIFQLFMVHECLKLYSIRFVTEKSAIF